MASGDLFVTATFVLITTNLRLASADDFLNWCDESTYSSDPELVKLTANITSRRQFGHSTCYIYIGGAAEAMSVGEARKICQDYRATLLTIHSEEEHQFVCRFVERRDRPVIAFLGLNERKLWSNDWIWDDHNSEQYLQCKPRPREVENCSVREELRCGVPYHIDFITTREVGGGEGVTGSPYPSICHWERCADAHPTAGIHQHSLFCKKTFTPPGTTSTAVMTSTASTAGMTTTTTASLSPPPLPPPPPPPPPSSVTTAPATSPTTTPLINAAVDTNGTGGRGQVSKGATIFPSLALVIILAGARRAFKVVYE